MIGFVFLWQQNRAMVFVYTKNVRERFRFEGCSCFFNIQVLKWAVDNGPSGLFMDYWLFSLHYRLYPLSLVDSCILAQSQCFQRTFVHISDAFSHSEKGRVRRLKAFNVWIWMNDVSWRYVVADLDCCKKARVRNRRCERSVTTFTVAICVLIHWSW